MNVVKMTAKIEALKKAYPPFKQQIAFKEFASKVDSLKYEMPMNFVRASLLYQQALKCKDCEPNVAMVLLCSCADAVKVAGEGAGSKNNFMTFYMKYCPSGSRVAPMKYYPNKHLPLQDVPFQRALDLIYAKFRCLYVHEGIGRIQLPPEDMNLFMNTLLDKHRNDIYSIDILRILEWFSRITLESLYAML